MPSPAPSQDLITYPPEFERLGYTTDKDGEDSPPGSPVVEEPTLTPSQLGHVQEIGTTMSVLGRAAHSGMFTSDETAAASVSQFARHHTDAIRAVAHDSDLGDLISQDIGVQSDGPRHQSPPGPREQGYSYSDLDHTPLQQVSSRAPRIPSMRFSDPLSRVLHVSLASAMQDPTPPPALQEEGPYAHREVEPLPVGTQPLSITIPPVQPLRVRRRPVAPSPMTQSRSVSPAAAPSLRERQYYPPSPQGFQEVPHSSHVLKENEIDLLHPSSARSPSRSPSSARSASHGQSVTRGRSHVRGPSLQQRGQSRPSMTPTTASTTTRSSGIVDDGDRYQSQPQHERLGKVDAGTQVSPPPSPTLTSLSPLPLRPAPLYSPPRARRGPTSSPSAPPGSGASVAGERRPRLPAAAASTISLSGSHPQRRPEGRVFYSYTSQSSPSLPAVSQQSGGANVPTQDSGTFVGGLKKAGGKLRSGLKGARRRAKGIGKAIVGLGKRPETAEFRNPSPKLPPIEVGVLEETTMTPEEFKERRREIYLHASASFDRLHRLQHEENPNLLAEDCDSCWAVRHQQSPSTVIGITLHNDLVASRSGSSLSGMYDLPPTRPSTRTSNFSFVSDISISSMV